MDVSEEFSTKFVPLAPDEEVLSDVHLSSSPSGDPACPIVSRFVFTVPADLRPQFPEDVGRITRKNNEEKFQENNAADEDLDLQRLEVTREVILIEHTLSTVLENVGTQVWRGALYLCDFILANPAEFINQNVLELGAGVGLVSVLLKYVGVSNVFCTDHSTRALALCRRNEERNAMLYQSRATWSASAAPFFVRRLDWMDLEFPRSSEPPVNESGFCWSVEELTVLQNGFSVVAADVIYSEELTDAFLDCLLMLSEKFSQRLTVHLALEKRINFTLEDLDVCSPPYRHFQRRLVQLSLPRTGESSLTAERLPDTFPQRFEYERVPELEIWKLTINRTTNTAK